METAEAISAIRSNWPDERYTMLREALTKAIAALEAVEAGQPAHNISVMALVQEWTRQAQNGSNTDDERAIYERCASALHQLNAAK